MSKPTPGPWKATSTGHIVSTIHNEADARLIAAAPELLAALWIIVNECENMAEARTQARAAIAKAEGGS